MVRSASWLARNVERRAAESSVVTRDGVLKLHFEHRMALIKLRRPREITQRDEKTGQHTKSDDPNPLDKRMPEAPKIEPALQFCEFSRQMR